MNYDWNFSRLVPYSDAFLSGTLVTIKLTLATIIFGTILGVLLGLALRKKAFRFVLVPFIDLVRAIPPIVLLLFFYYLLTIQVIGTTIGAFWVCIIAMTLNLAAFTADVTRSALENVPKTALDAGRALGMTQSNLYQYVTFPHALREAAPSMTILYIGILKMTSLASVINVREVVYSAQTVIADISRSLEAWAIVTLIYVILVIPASYAARRFESWLKHGSPSTPLS